MNLQLQPVINSHRLTEHGHVLFTVKVPVAPVGPVSMQCGVLLIIVCRLCAEGVDHTDVAPRQKSKSFFTVPTIQGFFFSVVMHRPANILTGPIPPNKIMCVL